MNFNGLELPLKNFDPIKYICEEAGAVCSSCDFTRLYPRSEKPCIDYVLEMGKNIVKRMNDHFEQSLAQTVRRLK